MSPAKFLSVYNSDTPQYQQSFATFLQHTNQKIEAKKRLDQIIQQLKHKQVFIDVGAGSGEITARYSNSNSPLKFAHTIAIEPNQNLCQQLRLKCPEIEIISRPIAQVKIVNLADLIICSHVFYYIPKNQWLINLETIASWLKPGGILILILQNYQTDCMKMIYKFLGKYYNLVALKDRFLQAHSSEYQAKIELVKAKVQVNNFTEAYTIAEFMFNCFTIPKPPPLRQDIEEYLQQHFTTDNGYLLSCDQDILVIKKNLPLITD